MASPATEDVRAELLAFVHLCRRLGLTIPTGQVLTFVDAAASLGPGDRVDLYWAGRTTLVSHRSDLGVYDLAFRTFFGAGAPVAEDEDERGDTDREVVVAAPDRDPAGGTGGDEEPPTEVGAVASDVRAAPPPPVRPRQ